MERGAVNIRKINSPPPHRTVICHMAKYIEGSDKDQLYKSDFQESETWK